ncbi:MAG: TraM recognition domain-containing protein [Bacteriovorax sp.]|nr:TraM recognition domain-containing protein [Bacteriovorax sp.]
MAEDNQKSDTTTTIFLGIVGVFFVTQLLYKIHDWFVVWIKSPLHKWFLLFIVLVIFTPLLVLLWKKLIKIRRKNIADYELLSKPKNNKEVGAVYCGESKEGKLIWIRPKQRIMHTQIIGTTNAGKTESVILPWLIQDIQHGRGLILIDGKPDRALLDKIWAYTVKAGREKDFKLFSLSNIEESHQFNPLIGGTADEISERVFNSFEFDNPYYKSLQYEVFSQIMRIFEAAKVVPTFSKIYQAIGNPNILQAMTRELEDKSLKDWAESFKSLNPGERSQRTSGLTAAISHFSQGSAACLFNAEKSSINLNTALEKNQIIYFQLPVLKTPFLGKTSGRMILQCLQSAVANRHNSKEKGKFFSVFLDDFTEYLYPGFVSILNKSRSANVGIVFAHQALGDIKTLGEPIANSILTNSNLKIFMRGNDPDSAEYFSKVIGTEKTMKYTERTTLNAFGKKGTGDASAREVEEFSVHPNIFKRKLGVGEAIMIVPHDAGSKVVNIKFDMFSDLSVKEKLKIIKKPKITMLEIPTDSVTIKSA